MSQGDPPDTAKTLLRESDLRDEIETIERRQSRLLVSYASILVILVVAMLQGPLGVPAAVVFVMILVPLKKAIVRYRALASRKTDLLEDLDSVCRLQR